MVKLGVVSVAVFVGYSNDIVIVRQINSLVLEFCSRI